MDDNDYLLMMDRAIYGVCYTMNGKRVDPRTIKPENMQHIINIEPPYEAKEGWRDIADEDQEARAQDGHTSEKQVEQDG